MATIYLLPAGGHVLQAGDLGELAELLECVLAGDHFDGPRACEPGQPPRLLTADEYQQMLVHLVRLSTDRKQTAR